MSNNTMECSSLNALRIALRGLVQGVGMRPAVARLANELGLSGFVRNNRQGVDIHVEGPAADVECFVTRLPHEFPQAARIDGREQTTTPLIHASDFVIEHSPVLKSMATRVPPDVSMCDSCRAEVLDPQNRRYQYPFTTCTACGPRYSLIESLPFDRERTSMRSFTMCAECEREYHDPNDRRFHSQTNCCPQCGPQIRFKGGRGWTELAKEAPEGAIGNEAPGFRSYLAPTPAPRRQHEIDPIRSAAAAIRNGLIVAMKGLGGYQLICDATSDSAVSRLRQRKRRLRKPLAVMVESVEEAMRFVEVSLDEETALASPKNPIVLLLRRPDQAKRSSGNAQPLDDHAGTSSLRSSVRPTIASDVIPNLNHVGIMLPTSPLHLLLLREAGVPCVVTSGNGSDEPLAFQNASAEEALQTVADVWLHLDRPIIRPIDDSVVRVINQKPVTIRVARGLAPMPLNLKSGGRGWTEPVKEAPENAAPEDVPGFRSYLAPTPATRLNSAETILAVGGQQKVALALSTGDQAVLGAHIGDMTSVATRQRFVEQVKATCQLYSVQPAVIAHDLHPDYFTTQWAKDQGKRTIGVQHHHAHIVSGMLEHGWLDYEVLGVAFDGTGYGTDGTIWGGEFLLSTATSFRRVARLRPFPLIGGERAVKEPWRIAAALLQDAGVALTSFTSGVPGDRSEARQELRLPTEKAAESLDDFRYGEVSERFPSLTRRDSKELSSPRSANNLFPVTSSMGRLFDGVASLLLNIDEVSYEGEAAMRLEAVCDVGADGFCDLPVVAGETDEIDWRPMMRQLVNDMQGSVATGTIAMKFVRGVALATAVTCRGYPNHRVVLSGGCFQNAVLTDQVAKALKDHPMPIGFPGRIPPNDGGLAAGQLAVAAATLAASQKDKGAV